MLTIVGCIACFLAAYVERVQHVKTIENGKVASFAKYSKVKANVEGLPLLGELFQSSGFKYLEIIRISNSEKYDCLQQRLETCSALKGILWDSRPLSETDIDSIVKLENLSALNLSRLNDCSQICDRIPEMKNLQVLTFFQCGISEHSFRRLANAASVHVIVFKQCSISKVQIQWLRKRLPETFVVFLAPR